MRKGVNWRTNTPYFIKCLRENYWVPHHESYREGRKQILHILVDSRSTRNFLNSSLAHKLQNNLTTITPITIQSVNRGKMSCTSVCKGLKWEIQGVCFEADMFIMDLSNYDMVLGVQ